MLNIQKKMKYLLVAFFMILYPAFLYSIVLGAPEIKLKVSNRYGKLSNEKLFLKINGIVYSAEECFSFLNVFNKEMQESEYKEIKFSPSYQEHNDPLYIEFNLQNNDKNFDKCRLYLQYNNGYATASLDKKTNICRLYNKGNYYYLVFSKPIVF